MAETAKSAVTKRVCPQCRQVFPGGASFCPHDGVPLIDRSRTFSSLDEGEESTKPRAVTKPGQEVDVTPGMLIGDYRVEHVIGEGGMGKIYAAIHPVIRKRVAVKVLNRRYAQDAKAIARFVLEARSVNEIGHHNIVDIFSIGELDDGRNYFIMEHLDGLGLDEILDRVGRLAPGQVLPVFEQLCDALEAAHAKGFVHRDLKPANVTVLRRPPHPFIKILDFGLAKLRGSATGFETKVGTVLGTPEYMAPEQCRGDQVDERTDVYALGVMLYELVTGRKPFFDPSPFKILVLQQGEPPRPPSELAPISPELEQVILKALRKDAAQRHPSARELLDDLRRAIPTPQPWVVDFAPTPPRQIPAHHPAPVPAAHPTTIEEKTKEWEAPPAQPSLPTNRGDDSIMTTIPMGVLNPLDTDEADVDREPEGLATIPMSALDSGAFPAHSGQTVGAPEPGDTEKNAIPSAELLEELRQTLPSSTPAVKPDDAPGQTFPLTRDMVKSGQPSAPASTPEPRPLSTPPANRPAPSPTPVGNITFEPDVSTSLVSGRRRRQLDDELASLVVPTPSPGKRVLFWIVLTSVAVAVGMGVALLLSFVV